MKEREALTLALEALCTCGPQQKQAIAAIKEALENHIPDATKMVAQPEQDEFALRGILARELKCWHRLTADEAQNLMAFVQNMVAMQAQPEQEPVAWMHNHIKGNVIAHRPADIDRHPEHWTALYPEPKPCPTCEALARTVMLDQTSHDTTPPQRTWVGLTDEEVKKIAYNTAERKVAKDIEAKLKEKNDC